MLDNEVEEEIFYLEQKTKVRIHGEQIVIDNPAGKYCLLSKKPITIPFEYLLTIETSKSEIEPRSKNTRKVFDFQVRVFATFLGEHEKSLKCAPLNFTRF